MQPTLLITPADEQAIAMLPATAWQAAVGQDGAVQEDKHIAEITHLMTRAAGWPVGLRWIVRRTKPSRRQAKNLTAFERATGWRYSVLVTNIPAGGGIGGVPSSSTCCTASTRSSRIGQNREGHGPAEPATETWTVNCGWMLAANIAADLSARCQLLGLYDCDDLKGRRAGHAADYGRCPPAWCATPAPAC